MKGLLYAGVAVAFFLLAWAFLRLARIFSTTEQSIKDVSEQVVPLIGKTHTTVDNINSQLSQLDEAVGDVAGMTDEETERTAELSQEIAERITRGLLQGGVAFDAVLGANDRVRIAVAGLNGRAVGARCTPGAPWSRWWWTRLVRHAPTMRA